jgi:hypothetical protein
LRGQLASRLEHQALRRLLDVVLCEQRQDGKSKGRSFPGAGLRGPNQIFTRKHDRKRAELDRRRLDKAHRLRSAHYFRRKSKMIK